MRVYPLSLDKFLLETDSDTAHAQQIITARDYHVDTLAVNSGKLYAYTSVSKVQKHRWTSMGGKLFIRIFSTKITRKN